MLICWLEPPAAKVQGDQIYRSRQPCEDLAGAAMPAGEEIYTCCGSWLSPGMRVAAREACLLVCAQSVEPDLLAIFVERRAQGLPTVFEVNDNFLEPRAFGAVGEFYHHPDKRSLTLQLLAAADAAQTSSATLAQVFGPYARRIEVFANAVQALEPLSPLSAARAPAKLRLGWGGSAGHDEDLRTIMPALKALLEQLPELTLAIMAPESLRPLFAWVDPARLDFRPDGSLAAYQAFLQTLDIGLAPLDDTAFNRGRSDVKFVEYAAAGACAVVQRAAAYASVREKETALTFANNEELVQAVSHLAGDRAARVRLRTLAHAYLQAERTRPQMLAQRLRFYRGLTAHLGPTRTSARTRTLQALACGAQGARPVARSAPGRSTQVALDVADRHLFNGLLEEQAHRSGRQDFANAIRARPEDYLGHLYLGHHAQPPGRGLQAAERALALAHHSPAAASAVAQQALAAGRSERAWEVWAQATAAQRSYVPLALAAHQAATQGPGGATAEAAAPLWQALSTALDHPLLAQALAGWWLRAGAGAGTQDARNESASTQQAEPGALSPGQALRPILAALRRASAAWPQLAALPLLRSQLLRASGQWEACWQQLRPLCAQEGAAHARWDSETWRGVYALGAEAARKTGRMATARQLARRATAGAHL